MTPYGIALLGCGTVGTGVAKLMLEHPERLTARAGRPLELRRIVVRDADRPRDPIILADLVTTDVNLVKNDPKVDVVVEVVGGIDWAKNAVLDLLAAGKH